MSRRIPHVNRNIQETCHLRHTPVISLNVVGSHSSNNRVDHGRTLAYWHFPSSVGEAIVISINPLITVCCSNSTSLGIISDNWFGRNIDLNCYVSKWKSIYGLYSYWCFAAVCIMIATTFVLRTQNYLFVYSVGKSLDTESFVAAPHHNFVVTLRRTIRFRILLGQVVSQIGRSINSV